MDYRDKAKQLAKIAKTLDEEHAVEVIRLYLEEAHKHGEGTATIPTHERVDPWVPIVPQEWTGPIWQVFPHDHVATSIDERPELIVSGRSWGKVV